MVYLRNVWSDLGYLICSRHLFKSNAGPNLKFRFLNPVFLHTCATCPELPSNNSTMIRRDNKKLAEKKLYPSVFFSFFFVNQPVFLACLLSSLLTGALRFTFFIFQCQL